MATYNDIKKIKIGDNVFVFHVPTASEVGALPSSTVIPPAYSLPLAANGTRGGVQIGYTQSGKNYPVQLSSEKMYVNVPWTDSDISTLTLASGSTAGTALSHGGKYTLTAGSKTVSFTMPSVGTIPSITLNGSTTTSPSFYAPTGAGTSGQYLKSSGSGAPTWTNFPTIPTMPTYTVSNGLLTIG